MNNDLQKQFEKEKLFSNILRIFYLLSIFMFFYGLYSIFTVTMFSQTTMVIFFLLGVIVFLVSLYLLIYALLYNHQQIANAYQQIYDLENSEPKPSFDDCIAYFNDNGFTIYSDSKVIIANKLILLNHKGLIKRDYLIQIVVTAQEMDTEENSMQKHFEIHAKEFEKYNKRFDKMLTQTKNKIITVGCHLHFIPNQMPPNLIHEFNIQARQRYLLRFDMIYDQENLKLYYPAHIESYEHRSWCGQLVPQAYVEVAKFINQVFSLKNKLI